MKVISLSRLLFSALVAGKSQRWSKRASFFFLPSRLPSVGCLGCGCGDLARVCMEDWRRVKAVSAAWLRWMQMAVAEYGMGGSVLAECQCIFIRIECVFFVVGQETVESGSVGLCRNTLTKHVFFCFWLIIICVLAVFQASFERLHIKGFICSVFPETLPPVAAPTATCRTEV